MRPFFIASVAMVGLWLGVARAECQTGSSKTWPALFGGTATRAAKPGGLDLSAQLFSAYDDDVLADQAGSGSNRPRPATSTNGFYSGLGISLLYARPSDRAAFRSWANSATNYYPALRDLTTTYYDGGLGLSVPLGRRFKIDASSFGRYSPRYSMQLFPVPLPLDPVAGSPVADGAEPGVPDVDFTIVESNRLRYGGRAGLSLFATGHSSVKLTYGHARTTSSGDRSADFEVHNASVSLDHRLTKYASFRMGYLYGEGTYERSIVPITRTHGVDLGIDYAKPLSRRRRTFVHFSTGSVIADQADLEGGRRIHAVGNASLVHQMGRTWTALAQYRREIRYIEGFVRPVLSDSASSSVSGLITRRVDAALSARYSGGTEGLNASSPRFESYSASALLRRAVTRTLAVYIEYLFYHYEFDEAAVRPANLPRQFNRNGVRVGLSLWLPLTD